MENDEIRTLEVTPDSEQDSIEAEKSEVPQSEVPEGEAQTNTVIYTGSNIFSLALQRFQVFKEGLPPYVKRAIERIPEIQRLIVPVNELEATRTKIDKPGTPEARFFVAIQKAADALSREKKVKR